MVVLAVDNDVEDLKLLCESIRKVHTDAEIVCFIDPLMAFKYSVFHSVDFLYTAIQMKRMNGFDLEKKIREDHPDLIVNYIAQDDSLKMKSIQYFANSYTVKPVTAEKLKKAELEEF